MKLNEHGYKLITDFEGLILKPYLHQVKVPTIGYGSTYYLDGRRVTMLDKSITQKEAYNMFKEIADRFAKAVSKGLKQPVTQNQFNALVSLAYNIGTGAFLGSTLLRKVNVNPNDPSINFEFKRWNKAGGQVLSGLSKRRNYEAEIYFTK